jgi:hypothetical protein
MSDESSTRSHGIATASVTTSENAASAALTAIIASSFATRTRPLRGVPRNVRVTVP